MIGIPSENPDSEISISPEDFIQTLSNRFSEEIARLTTDNVSLRMLVDALRTQRDEYANQIRTIIPPLPTDADAD